MFVTMEEESVWTMRREITEEWREIYKENLMHTFHLLFWSNEEPWDRSDALKDKLNIWWWQWESLFSDTVWKNFMERKVILKQDLGQSVYVVEIKW